MKRGDVTFQSHHSSCLNIEDQIIIVVLDCAGLLASDAL